MQQQAEDRPIWAAKKARRRVLLAKFVEGQPDWGGHSWALVRVKKPAATRSRPLHHQIEYELRCDGKCKYSGASRPSNEFVLIPRDGGFEAHAVDVVVVLRRFSGGPRRNGAPTLEEAEQRMAAVPSAGGQDGSTRRAILCGGAAGNLDDAPESSPMASKTSAFCDGGCEEPDRLDDDANDNPDMAIVEEEADDDNDDNDDDIDLDSMVDVSELDAVLAMRRQSAQPEQQQQQPEALAPPPQQAPPQKRQQAPPQKQGPPQKQAQKYYPGIARTVDLADHVTKKEVADVLRARGGRMRQRDLVVAFSARVKTEAARAHLKSLLNELCDTSEATGVAIVTLKQTAS